MSTNNPSVAVFFPGDPDVVNVFRMLTAFVVYSLSVDEEESVVGRARGDPYTEYGIYSTLCVEDVWTP
jgi:hypothetical protein